MLCYAMLCYAMLCYAMLCYAMLCYAMLCYAMLCYAMLCAMKGIEDEAKAGKDLPGLRMRTACGVTTALMNSRLSTRALSRANSADGYEVASRGSNSLRSLNCTQTRACQQTCCSTWTVLHPAAAAAAAACPDQSPTPLPSVMTLNPPPLSLASPQPRLSKK